MMTLRLHSVTLPRMGTSGHPEFFASVANAGRRGRTMAEVHAAGGPAVPTLVRAEAGKLLNPKPKTFSKFDVGLGWVPGSAARAYWHAEQPVPATKSQAPTPLRFGRSSVQVPLERVLSLLDVQRDLNTLVESNPAAVPTEEVQQVARRLDQEVSIIVGRWATNLLERNRIQGSAHPGLDFAFADTLSNSVTDDDPDAEDRLYRRWLFGRSESELDDAQREMFGRRYEAREGGDDDQ